MFSLENRVALYQNILEVSTKFGVTESKHKYSIKTSTGECGRYHR